MTLLNGPRLTPASGKAATGLVVFLHGYGADGNDLIDIGQMWAGALPDVAFASPNAPEPCAMNPMGRQWFGLTMRNDAERWNGVSAARAALDAFLDAELKSYGLGNDRLVLVGFSQGTMMALHVGLRRLPQIGGIVGYSGLLAGPEHLGEVTARPPITLLHGDRDPILPIQHMHEAEAALKGAGFAVTSHTFPGLAHGIDPRGLQIGLSAIKTVLGV